MIMKRFWMVGILLCPLAVSAQRPVTPVGPGRPGTSVITERAQTTVSVFRPTTGGTQRPQTSVQVTRPETAQITRPQTSVSAVYPQTTVEVLHPQTTVEVLRPQTTVEVFRPQTPVFAGEGNTPAAPGKTEKTEKTTSAQATTSMSDFKPKPAKDLKPELKAPDMGGGSLSLGNDTAEQAAKDAMAANNIRSGQRENVESADLKNNAAALSGLDKMLTDRTKVQQKK